MDAIFARKLSTVNTGRRAAGKTSVAHRLIHNRFKRNCQETQGVDISRWRLRCEGREVDVNVWDFAGQVMTHSTHRFILSESSVYVLVLTGREDTQGTDADYWLRLIRAFGSDGVWQHFAGGCGHQQVRATSVQR